MKRLAQSIDQTFLKVILSVLGDRNGIRGLLFHSVFLDEDEISTEHILPQQALTLEHYRWIFEYFLRNGYRFIGYSDLVNGLSPQDKYIYVTFDDGYYNNVRILPLIEELRIPIHVFVTTNNILENKKFWWDVVYQQRRAAGLTQIDIKRELSKQKKLRPTQAESFLAREFRSEAFEPISDLDRPLTPDELLDLSNHQLVTIGNHTWSHRIVTTLTSEEVRVEVTQCSADIRRITGREPSAFAFPNGNNKQEDVALVKSLGVDVILSSDPKNNKVPSAVERRDGIFLGRYCFSGNYDLEWQARMVRAGGSPVFRAQQLRARLRQ